MAGIVRLDKVQAVQTGNIVSVQADKVMENGMIVKVGSLLEGEREIYKAEAPTAVDPVAVLAAPEINYDECRTVNKALEHFTNEANKPIRAYNLVKDDIISVSKDLVTPLSSKVVVGNVVIADTGVANKFKEAAEASTEAFVAEIIGTEIVGGTTVITSTGAISRATEYVVLKVKKNA